MLASNLQLNHIRGSDTYIRETTCPDFDFSHTSGDRDIHLIHVRNHMYVLQELWYYRNTLKEVAALAQDRYRATQTTAVDLVGKRNAMLELLTLVAKRGGIL